MRSVQGVEASDSERGCLPSQLHFVLDANNRLRNVSCERCSGSPSNREHVRKAPHRLSHSARSGTSVGVNRAASLAKFRLHLRVRFDRGHWSECQRNCDSRYASGPPGNQTAANMAWKRAALLGSGIAQFKLGEIHYQARSRRRR